MFTVAVSDAHRRHGKVVTVSLKSHFSNVSDAQGMNLCDPTMSDDNTTACVPYGEEKIFEVLRATGAVESSRRRLYISLVMLSLYANMLAAYV